MTLHGAVRFFARSTAASSYASAVNLSASSPPQVFTSPTDWVEQLYTALGQFYTLGMPEETGALRDGVFSDDDYVRQVALVQKDSRAMLELALDRFDPGDATFVYLSDIDLQCHMLWRHADPKYPGWATLRGTRRRGARPRHRRCTRRGRRAGRVRERLPVGTRLLVMSDHGFQPYTRKFHLNAWLRDQGYLVLKDGKRTGHVGLEDVDWSRSLAYGLGLGSPESPGGSRRGACAEQARALAEIARRSGGATQRIATRGARVSGSGRSTASAPGGSGPRRWIQQELRRLRCLHSRRDHRGRTRGQHVALVR
jgi:hypothetical protein